jgi:hypothetical protein
MSDPTDPADLIEEAIERAEEREEQRGAAERAEEKSFRNRVSILVGLFAVALAVIHMAAAGNQRESILRNIEASDTFAYMQAKIIRETVAKTAAGAKDIDPAAKTDFLAEAKRLRAPDKAGHGIVQLQKAGDEAREESKVFAERSERYEMGETALQVAIVLLSIALIAHSWAIVIGSGGLALVGVLIAAGTALKIF